MLSIPKAKLSRIPILKFISLAAAIDRLESAIYEARYDAGYPSHTRLTYCVCDESMKAHIRSIRDAEET